MSGIVGIVNADRAPVDRDLLRQLTGSLTYRGPDAQSLWVDGHVGFGHTMLRTTDESASERQPMSIDGAVWITADARIDGRAELRRKLDAGRIAGLDVATDVELILHAYDRWDTECVRHLLGDFAFAIWDGRKQRLFCARDTFGVKPFFFVRLGRGLLFGNTLNCLRLDPSVSDTLNEIAIGDFLLFGTNQDPATTTFADIQRLPGAHCLTWAADHFRVRRYWSLPIDGHIRHRRSSDYVEHFTDIFRTAVDDRLRTRRVTCEMSGGLDSPAIAATARSLLAARGEPFEIRAYCNVWDRLIPDRERHFSGLAARALDIPIEHLVNDDVPLFATPIRGDVREPEPFGIYPGSVSDAVYFRATEAHSRVLLTGWDGDALLDESPRFYFRKLLREGSLAELAAGWGWFLGARRSLPPMGVRTWLKRQVHRMTLPSKFPAWIDPAFVARRHLHARWLEIHAERRPPHPTRPRASRLLLAPNWWALFERYDPGVTGALQEARHPLLDCRLVEYVLAIPPVPWSIGKHILRCAMAGTLPDDVRVRRKTPLAGDPALEIVRHADRHPIDEFTASTRLAGYVNRTAIRQVAGETSSDRLWANVRPYVLNRWLESAFPRRAAADCDPDDVGGLIESGAKQLGPGALAASFEVIR